MWRIAVTALFIAHLTGCVARIPPVQRPADAAHERFSREYSCPGDQVSTEELGGSAYQVHGCGQAATYVCTPDKDDNPVCIKERSEGAE